ncbi:MAG: asparagine synthase (glutamine-hydrolyzing) [Desulfovibrio sp.]|nr:MAG: asparagine synthase (glutamine-hydrolyzing) [Desulfovibrio sp.]
MTTADGRYTVVFNGEIYNHLELRAELQAKGRQFLTHHSDTEVLLHGYAEWGPGFMNRLNGMWALAIYDAEAGTLFLSRDRFGKKPLYYARKNGTFAFASELKALAEHPAIPTDISPRAVEKYFAYGFIPAPLALYRVAQKLKPGCSLLLDLVSGREQVMEYWRFVLEPFEDIPPNAVDTWGQTIRELLDKAVERRLMSDVPLGVFLSGGMDSSSITAMACRHMGRGECRTLSIGFEESTFDESAYARLVAERFATDHHHRTFRGSDPYMLLLAITLGLDEPMGDSSILPTYLLCQEARRHVTVALGGDGADELFAGYDPFRALKLAKLYSTLVPKPVHKAIRLLAAKLPVSHGYMSTVFRIQRVLLGLSYPRKLWNPTWLGPVEPKDLGDLLERPIDLEDVYSEAIEAWDACPSGSLVDRTLMFYTRLYLSDDILAKVDRASMLHGLEVRSPYLDKDLVDFVRRIPARFKYGKGTTKRILRQALKPVIPATIIERSKQGFAMPIGQLLQKRVIGFSFTSANRLMNPAFLVRKLNEHLEKKADNRLFLWNAWLMNEMLLSQGLINTDADNA